LEYAFRLCLGRKPTAEEKSVLLALLAVEKTDGTGAAEQRRFAAGKGAANIAPEDLLAWTSIARTLLNLDEFITRE
jgi:hypothetical protein